MSEVMFSLVAAFLLISKRCCELLPYKSPKPLFLVGKSSVKWCAVCECVREVDKCSYDHCNKEIFDLGCRIIYTHILDITVTLLFHLVDLLTVTF